MKVSKDFSDHEFVPPMIYEHFVDKSLWFIDPCIVVMAQFIRNRFGKQVTIEAGTATWIHADCRFSNQDSLLIVPFK